MAKLYSKKKATAKDLKPKKEVIDFLLNYSRAVTMVKTKTAVFEIIAN